MFVVPDGESAMMPSTRRVPPATRSASSGTKWDTVKSFYYDPAKWDLIKSVAFFGLAVYFIRDFAANDMLPMD